MLDEIEKYRARKENLRSEAGDMHARVDIDCKQALLRNAGGKNNSTVRLVEPPPYFCASLEGGCGRRSNTVVVGTMKQVFIPWL